MFFQQVLDGITGHSPNAESVAALNNAQANILNAQAQQLANQGQSKMNPVVIAVIVLVIILILIAVFIKMKKKA